MTRLTQILSSILLSSIVLTSGCAVIHFENGEVVPEPKEDQFSWHFGLFDDDEGEPAETAVRHRKWYHHAILQVAEISNPLEFSQVCTGLDWNQVTTEVTPFDAVAGLLDNVLLMHASSAGLDLWSPWSIEYSCRDVK